MTTTTMVRDDSVIVKSNNRHGQNIEICQRALEILAALSLERNLKLFYLAEKGLKFNFPVLAELRISRKQYYKGIRQLQQLGLIHKIENKYYQSTFGILVYHQSISKISDLVVHSDAIKLIDVCLIAHSDVIQMIDLLKKSGKLDDVTSRLIEKVAAGYDYGGNRDGYRESGVKGIITSNTKDAVIEMTCS